MALVHGAKGFGYFCHSWYGGFKEAGWLEDSQMKNAITAINAGINDLAPVLNSPSIDERVTVASDDHETPVDIMVKSHSGSLYIFATVMRGNPVTATFSIRGMAGNVEIKVLHEDREVTSTDGKFEDDFEGYGVHLYKIALSADVSASLSRNRTALPPSYRLIPVMQGERSPAPVLSDLNGAVTLYSLHGTRMRTVSGSDRKRPDVSAGVYVVPQKR